MLKTVSPCKTLVGAEERDIPQRLKLVILAVCARPTQGAVCMAGGFLSLRSTRQQGLDQRRLGVLLLHLERAALGTLQLGFTQPLRCCSGYEERRPRWSCSCWLITNHCQMHRAPLQQVVFSQQWLMPPGTCCCGLTLC